MRVRVLGIAVASGLLALAAWASVAGASRSAPQPSTVLSASLTQSAQQVVWKVTLSAPFSPRQMTRAHRSLCLLIEHPPTAGVSGLLCVIGPRTGETSPRLVYQQWAHGLAGPAHVVAATVTRPTTSELTPASHPAPTAVRHTTRSAGRCARRLAHRPAASGAGTCFRPVPSWRRCTPPKWWDASPAARTS